MPQVVVTIDGKTYRMACDEGQEQHLTDLAERFNGYVTHLRNQFGEIGDQRLTVMAGIMLVDELTEMQRRLRGLETEVESLRKTRDEALSRAEGSEIALAETLASVSGKIEGLAAKLNAG